MCRVAGPRMSQKNSIRIYTQAMTGNLLDARACGPCAKSKRRCGKQLPRCLRCTQRDIDCVYPPARPLSFVVFTDDDGSSINYESTTQLSAEPPSNYSTGSSDGGLSRDTGSPGVSRSTIDHHQSSANTWAVTFPGAGFTPSYVQDCVPILDRIRDSLFRWVEQGSSEFIHSHLYRTRFPEHVQDAYLAVSMYLHRNQSNRYNVLRIIEGKAKKLVEHYATDAAGSSPMDVDVNDTAVKESFEHLARVHSLLAYQITGLFDGDIRLRHVSENHIQVLNTWIQSMAKHASQSADSEDPFAPSSRPGQTAGLFGVTAHTHREDLRWHSWILAESIRRTWSVASGVQAGYLMVLEGQPVVPCMGSMMFTPRLGVWEAQSAMEWERISSKDDIGLVQMSEAEGLFTKVSPDEINEFTKITLATTFGYERVKRWESKH
ncbi:hypothetical protein BX600DRAFT_474883 [Xylariales sp. PMI_506]|nr:hypothetical protein BX600DRAFT_474883 [Xylariales sp. PMI_506]